MAMLLKFGMWMQYGTRGFVIKAKRLTEGAASSGSASLSSTKYVSEMLPPSLVLSRRH